MNPPSLRVSNEPHATAQDVERVKAGLRAFNVARLGDPHESPVRLFLRDDAGEIAGGLLGHLRWRWLYVSKLWVDDAHRGAGHGTRLLQAAESHASAQRCIGAYLDTFEFQARPFYEKLGYSLFGTLEGYPPGYRQYFLWKSLRDGA